MFLAVGAFALAATGMTSCNNGEDETYDTNWTVEASYLESEEAGTPNLYSISFVDNSIEFDASGMTTAGNGYMVTFWVNSSSTNEPAEGTYEVSETGEDNTLTPGTPVQVSGISMIGGTSVFKVTDGDYTNDDITMCEEGTLELKKDGGDWIVKAALPLVDGETLNISWKGAIAFIKADTGEGEGEGEGEGTEIGDPAWPFEPTTAENVQIEFSQARAQILNNQGNDYIQITLTSNSEQAILALFAADVNNPYGTYEISSSMQSNTAAASAGGQAEENADGSITVNMSPSCVTTGISNGGFSKAFYLASGTIEYTANSVKINAKSHHGSTVQGVYNGNAAPTQGVAAEKVAMRKAQPILKAKPFMAR